MNMIFCNLIIQNASYVKNDFRLKKVNQLTLRFNSHFKKQIYENSYINSYILLKYYLHY